jgi:ketosteroid isomerase-like protein
MVTKADTGVEGGGTEADHEALRNLKTVFENAINQNDMETIRPYLDDEFTVVTYTDREFTDFDAFKAQWVKTRKKLLGNGSYYVELIPHRSTIYDDTAIARGDSKNLMITECGETYKFSAKWSAVCRKVDGEWKILRAHNSLDPFGNPILRRKVLKYGLILGVTAVAAGLALGATATYKLLKSSDR